MTEVLELVVCPFCKGRLSRSPKTLDCTSCGRSFALRDGVVDLLAAPQSGPKDQGPGLAGRALGALVARPFFYDLVQRMAGANVIQQRIRPLLEQTEGGLVLDVGAGTGNLETVLPGSARYVWLDLDRQKLGGFQHKSSAPAVLGDATDLPLKDDSVDWALSFGVSHHLNDEQLRRMLDEVRRVTRKGLFFLDGVLTPAIRSRLLWYYDRGRYPRASDALLEELARPFSIASAQEFTVAHRYLLVTAV
jgi:SAM-dependent methyltransferase